MHKVYVYLALERKLEANFCTYSSLQLLYLLSQHTRLCYICNLELQYCCMYYETHFCNLGIGIIMFVSLCQIHIPKPDRKQSLMNSSFHGDG